MHSMPGLRSRRLLFAAVFAMALLVLVFLQILYGDVSWVSSSLNLGLSCFFEVVEETSKGLPVP